MAYFKPLEYSPFSYTGDVGPRLSHMESWGDRTYDESPAQYSLRQQGDVTGQYRDYSGQQFQSLFDAVNNMGNNPAMSGEMFNNAPRYSPYEGTRADFTTGGEYYEPEGVPAHRPTVFNQQGYLDAQFNNINDYLGKMGSFFGNMGNGDNTAALLANMQGQGPRPVMPSVGMPSVGMGGGFNPSAGGTGGTGGTSGNNPFQSFGALKSGGWGTAPTSLFGAGAGNANNT